MEAQNEVGSSYQEVDIPSFHNPETVKEESETDDSFDTFDIVATDISPCGNFMTVCGSNKSLYIWNTKSWTLLSHRMSCRVASSVKFTPSSKAIILADRAGNAYKFSVKNSQKEGILLLGHMSMLLDVLVTPNEQFIITCDRDEKIRVSEYPNAYNIYAYCLGHDEFVKGLHLLPHDPSVLISYSGDGTIRFWKYEEGKELHVVNASGDVSVNKVRCSDISNNAEATSENEQTLAVRLLSSCKYDNNVSLIGTCVSKIACCLIYRVVGNSEVIKVSLIQVLKCQEEPWDILLYSEKFYYLCPVNGSYVKLLALDASTSHFIEEKDEKYLKAIEFFNSNSKLFEKLKPPELLQILYKRKFDDLNEYQEKKQQRLMSKNKKIKKD